MWLLPLEQHLTRLFIPSLHLPLPDLYKDFQITSKTFTLKMETAIFAEMLENTEHTTQLNPELQRSSEQPLLFTK
ncbi:hypothetical protein L798_01245 [Zootermopsis nevadensis]|uniref:Uncharacterized protein n=1 Tax=Zootermopsis nevadensis TaxID=136037 RepID=A0A067QLP9_ZOONE|nr:hypothetical protein L798_01245 [Zootermopsis nevadensis]